MKKLFIVIDGSHPECYEGENLLSCIASMLSCMEVDDDYASMVIEDLHEFVQADPDEHGRIKQRFSTMMLNSAEWCYGYETWEEAFETEKEDAK